MLIFILVSCTKEETRCYNCTTITEGQGYYDEYTFTECDWTQEDASNYIKETTRTINGIDQYSTCK